MGSWPWLTSLLAYEPHNTGHVQMKLKIMQIYHSAIPMSIQSDFVVSQNQVTRTKQQNKKSANAH